MSDIDKDVVAREFAEAINMTATVLEHWLQTKESRSVGFHHEGEAEAVGHEEGRRLVAILHTMASVRSDDDYAHMRKAVGYVHRHLAQGGPAHDVEHSRWRYSLMNGGHDPLKK